MDADIRKYYTRLNGNHLKEKRKIQRNMWFIFRGGIMVVIGQNRCPFLTIM